MVGISTGETSGKGKNKLKPEKSWTVRVLSKSIEI